MGCYILLPCSPLFPPSALLHRPATSSYVAGVASPQPRLRRSSTAPHPVLSRPLRPIPSQISGPPNFLLPSSRCRRLPCRRRPLEKPCTPSTARTAAVDGLARWKPRAPRPQNVYATLPFPSCRPSLGSSSLEARRRSGHRSTRCHGCHLQSDRAAWPGRPAQSRRARPRP
jgi:hypothetical protein